MRYYNNTTSSLSRQPRYAVDAFSEYVRLHPEIINRSRFDYHSILDFAEANSLNLIWRNIHYGLGKRKDILNQLSHIHRPQNLLKKYMCIVYCSLPKFVQTKLYSAYVTLKNKLS